MSDEKIKYIHVRLACAGKDKQVSLGLPVEAEQLGKVFSDLGVQKKEDLQIKQVSSPYASIGRHLSGVDNLDALNTVAVLLSNLKDYELVLVCAAAEMDLSQFGGSPLDVLVNVLGSEDNLNGFEVIDAFNETELGRYWAAEENLDMASDAQLAAYGRENMKDGGRFTEWGYVRCKFKPVMYYDSDNLPEKGRFVDAALQSMGRETGQPYPAIYPHSFDTARENGEQDLFWESNKIDRGCARAIDKAVRDSNYEPYHYDLPAAAKSVISEYGAERVKWVLAQVLQQHEWDGRLSQNSKEWAKGFNLPPCSHPIMVNTHLSILDGFINEVRKAALEKELQPAQPGDTPGEYKYYALRRPIDIGTLPREPRPESVVNFDSKRFVDDRSFSAWGYAYYSKPLTKKQIAEYELRADSSNPPGRASVVDRLKAGRTERKPPQTGRGRKREAEI